MPSGSAPYCPAAQPQHRGHGHAPLSRAHGHGSGLDHAGARRQRVTVHFGFGRTRAGHVGNEVGFNAYLLRTSAEPEAATDSKFRRPAGVTPSRPRSTPDHGRRGPPEIATLDEYKKNPQFVEQTEEDKAAPAIPDALSGLPISGLQVGHDHRSERLHRLQRLHRCLPGGEQHPGGRQRGSSARPPHALDPRGPLFQRQLG